MIINGDIDVESSPIGGWGDRLAASENNIRKAIASVGRIDVPGVGVGFQGTGFLIAPNLIVTNRHVLQVSARERNGEWKLIDGAAIDFGHEYRSRKSVNRRQLRRVVFCGSREIAFTSIDHGKLDLALIELESNRSGVAEEQDAFRLVTFNDWANPGRVIYVIGYPGSPPSSIYPPSLLEQLFQTTFGYKRLAPGEVIASQSVVSHWTLAHDATTLGGNSGSVLVVADNEGVAAGLHYGGRPSEPRENWGHVLASVLDETDGRSKRTLGELLTDHGVQVDGHSPTINRNPQPVEEPFKETPPSQPAGAFTPGNATGVATTAAVATFHVPIRVTVSVGAAVPVGMSIGSDSPVAEGEVEKVPVIFPDLESRKGYDDDFLNLSVQVPLPQLTAKGEEVAARLTDDSFELKYHKYSVVMHKHRRLALFTAANVDWRKSSREIDGQKPSRKKLNGFTGNEKEDWVVDPRIPLDHQIPDYFYVEDKGAFDRGHLVRRDDVAWGESFSDMQKANGDTFHMTNCSPQTAEFNRAADLNWGALENMIQKQTAKEKICLFSGPVFDETDFFFDGLQKSRVPLRVQIPSRFWKIVVFDNGGEPGAYGFVLDQDLINVPLVELVVPDAWKGFLHPISEIEELLAGDVKLEKLLEWDLF
jgi:endonuclease G